MLGLKRITIFTEILSSKWMVIYLNTTDFHSNCYLPGLVAQAMGKSIANSVQQELELGPSLAIYG